MITIDVVDHPTGLRLPCGVQYSMDFGGGPIEPLHPLLLSAQDYAALHFEEELGHIHYPSPEITFGPLRDKEVQHFNISGEVSASLRPIQSSIPFRGLVDWGMPFQDIISCRYDIHDTAFVERLREHSTLFHWFDDYLIIEFCVKELYYRVNGVDQYDGVLPHPIITLMGYFRSGGYIYDYPYAVTDMDSTSYTSDMLVGYLESMRTQLWPFRTRSVTSFCVDTSASSPPASVSDTVQVIRSRLQGFRGSNALIGSEMDLVDFGELASECANQLRYVDSNVLSLVFDIDDWRHIHTLWKQVVNLPGWKRAYWYFSRMVRTRKVKSWTDFGPMFLPLASSYLFKKYAVDTAISDLGRLMAGYIKLINEPVRQRLHSRREAVLDPGADSLYYHFNAVMTIELGSYPDGPLGKIQEAIGMVKRMGLYPSMTNLYDILPYSFVVDWFADYGGFVKECDQYLDVRNYFPIEYCIMSTKWSRGYNSSSIFPDFGQVSGQVEISFYNRWITRELPLPSVNPVSGGPGPIEHWAESLALVLQRAK